MCNCVFPGARHQTSQEGGGSSGRVYMPFGKGFTDGAQSSTCCRAHGHSPLTWRAWQLPEGHGRAAGLPTFIAFALVLGAGTGGQPAPASHRHDVSIGCLLGKQGKKLSGNYCEALALPSVETGLGGPMVWRYCCPTPGLGIGKQQKLHL